MMAEFVLDIAASNLLITLGYATRIELPVLTGVTSLNGVLYQYPCLAGPLRVRGHRDLRSVSSVS